LVQALWKLRVFDWLKSWTLMVIDWPNNWVPMVIDWTKSWTPRRSRATSCPLAAAAGIRTTAPAPAALWAGALVFSLVFKLVLGAEVTRSARASRASLGSERCRRLR
jgi:hypothetical protein